MDNFRMLGLDCTLLCLATPQSADSQANDLLLPNEPLEFAVVHRVFSKDKTSTDAGSEAS